MPSTPEEIALRTRLVMNGLYALNGDDGREEVEVNKRKCGYFINMHHMQ